MAAAALVLQAASRRYGLGLALDHDIAGHESLSRHGANVTRSLLEKVRAADAMRRGIESRLPDAAVRRKVLLENPARLYGF